MSLHRGAGSRQVALLASVIGMACVFGAGELQAAAAPHLHWQTIKTPCCDVHFPASNRALGVRVADMVDACVENAAQFMANRPLERIQVVMHDVTDSPNGFANVVPYDKIELRAVTPEDDSELAVADEYLRLLVQHEIFHVVHLDIIHGLPALVNLVVGKIWPPNSVQPRMFVEGLAVYAETRFTDGGRLRSSLFRAPLRVAALRGDRWSLDDVANASRRPPGGGAAYVYGSAFVAFLTERYGEGIWPAYAHDYGGTVIPYGVQRGLEAATGRDLLLDWEDFQASLLDEALTLKARADARGGPQEFRRLTRMGGSLRSPVFMSDGTLLFGANPPTGPAGLYTIAGLPAATPTPQALVRTADAADVAVVPGGDGDDDLIVFSQTETHERWYSFRDLFVRHADGSVRQLTFGQRLRNPSPLPVSADGRRRVIAEHRTGETSALKIVDVDTGAVEDLATAPPGTIAYGPVVSPDGTRLALALQDARAHRRLAIIDLLADDDDDADDDGTITLGPWQLLDDDAHRGSQYDPTWKDDNVVIFADDSDGVFNLFQLDLRGGLPVRVTDSLANIAQPVVSPDGGAVIFTDTHLDGVDLYVAALPVLPAPKAGAHSPLRPLSPRDVAPPSRPDSWDQARLNDVVVETYDPTWSLLPKSWSGSFAVGPEGPAFNVNLNGADAASLLSWQLAVAYNAAFLHPAASASVRLGNLTLPLSLSADVRPVVSARGRENDGLPELQVDTQIRGTASVTVPFRRRRFSHNLTFGGQRSVSIDQTGVTSAPDTLRPRYPSSVTAPVTTAFTLDWSYSGTEQYRDSVSTERGLTSFTRLRLADRTAFSDVDIREFVTDIRAFQPVPGLGNHVVGVYLSGGAAFDDRAGNSFFSGGFVGRDLLSDALGGDRSGAGVLRGFPLGHVSGSALAAGSLEYRFPLLEIEKGIETLPAYLERIHGAVFVDSAAGFDERASRMDFATGIGAELRVHLILGYYGLFVLRLGYARGLTIGGGDQPYAVLGFPY